MLRRAFWFSPSRSFAARAALARGVEAGLEGLLALGLFREAALGLAGGGVEPLKGDQALEIGIHHKQKKPRRSRTGALRVGTSNAAI